MITQIEVQYFDGCPHAPPAMELVKKYVQEHPDTKIKITQVRDTAHAAEIGFPGLPTILIDGKDLFDQPIPDEASMSCRFYPGGLPDYNKFVDVLISNCAINLSPDKDQVFQVFQESFRVLKPDGRLMISDIVLLATLPDIIKDSIDSYVDCLSGALLKNDDLGKIH